MGLPLPSATGHNHHHFVSLAFNPAVSYVMCWQKDPNKPRGTRLLESKHMAGVTRLGWAPCSNGKSGLGGSAGTHETGQTWDSLALLRELTRASSKVSK